LTSAGEKSPLTSRKYSLYYHDEVLHNIINLKGLHIGRGENMRSLILGTILIMILSLFLSGCSSKSPEELFNLAQQAENDGDFEKAIDFYTMLLRKYPHNEHNYKAQFMIGFIYSEELKDHEKAKLAMQKVVDNYPDCDLADDARWMLEHMGENLEEMEFTGEAMGGS
jgi:outer membrane protein assembly factor BamD (BamD/ComL family)